MRAQEHDVSDNPTINGGILLPVDRENAGNRQHAQQTFPRHSGSRRVRK